MYVVGTYLFIFIEMWSLWHKVNDFEFCFVSKCLHISNSRTKSLAKGLISNTYITLCFEYNYMHKYSTFTLRLWWIPNFSGLHKTQGMVFHLLDCIGQSFPKHDSCILVIIHDKNLGYHPNENRACTGILRESFHRQLEIGSCWYHIWK